MTLDRNWTLSITHPLGHALPVTIGELIDTIRDEVIKVLDARPTTRAKSPT